MNEETAERFARLESQATHLERLVEELNAVVIEQGRELDRMRKLLLRHGATMNAMELERIKSTNPKPPHYQ